MVDGLERVGQQQARAARLELARAGDTFQGRLDAARDEVGPARTPASFPAEVHEHPSEVARVLLHAVVLGLDFLLIQETQDPFLQLT